MTEYVVRTRPGQTTVRVVRPGGATRVRTRLAGGGGGGGGAGLPAGTAGQMFRIAEDGETVEAVTPNAPGAWLELDGDGYVPDANLAPVVVRESGLAAAIAAGAATLVEVHLPLAIEFVGGSFIDENTALLAPEGQPLPDEGTPVLWTEQGVASRNDVWIHTTGGTYVRSSPSALRAARVGTLIVVRGNALNAFAPQVLRVDAANSVEELVVDGKNIPVVAEFLVAVTAVDGSATTFQPIRRADDAPASGVIPANYLARGSALNVSSWVGVYVVIPTPDTPAGPSYYGRLYRIEAVGTPWTEVALAGNEPILIVGASDVGLPEWWVNRDTGPRPVHVSAHNVRLSRDPVANTPDTLKPWSDLNEVTSVLARAIEWTFIGVDDDWSWQSGLDRPSLWYTVDNTVAVPVTGTLPPLNDFPVGRSVRCTSYTSQAVTIVDSETSATVATLGELDSFEFTSNGAAWVASRINTTGGDIPADGSVTNDKVAASAGIDLSKLQSITAARLLGRGDGPDGDIVQLTAAQVRTLLGQGWHTIDQFVFTGAESSRTISVPAGTSRVRLTLSGRSTRAATTENIRLTLNGNTGSVYGINASALTTFWALGVLPGATTNTDRGGLITVDLMVLSGLTKAGWSMNQQSIVSTSTVGSAVTPTGLFSTLTAAVSTIELFAQAAAFAAGTALLVEAA